MSFVYPVVAENRVHEWGLSLRDYFASQALIGKLAADPVLAQSFPVLAADCYAIADAMIAEKESE